MGRAGGGAQTRDAKMAAAWGMDTNALQRFPTVNDKNFQVNDKKKLAQHTEGTKISPTAPCSIFLRRHTWRECISGDEDETRNTLNTLRDRRLVQLRHVK